MLTQLPFVSGLFAAACSEAAVNITEENGPVLTEMIQRNSTLEVLSLACNDQVSDTGAFFVVEGLKHKSFLRELYFDGCGIKRLRG